MKKKIEVTCKGADLVKRSDLKEFQGDLKMLTDDRMAMLKGQIIKYGFNSPIQIWMNGQTKHILDGHQRTRALDALAQDGYEVPDELPVDWILAKTKKQAKEILLSRIAQYGETTQTGLYSYMADAGLSFSEIKESFPLPNFDFSRFERDFLSQLPKKETVGAIEISEESYSNLMHTCPRCGMRFGKGAPKNDK